MARQKNLNRQRSSTSRLSPPEMYLLEIVVILTGLALLINGFANPSCLNGCNADFWGIAIINGVLATCMLFTLVVLLQTSRKRRKAKR